MSIREASLSDISIENLGEILAANNYIQYSEYDIRFNQLGTYIAEEIKNSLKQGQLVLLAEDNNKKKGLIAGGNSDWDSKHFGVSIAKIHHLYTSGDYYQKRCYTRQLLSYFEKKTMCKLLMTKSHSENTPCIHALEDKKFQLMDTLVTYYFDYTNNKIRDFNETCRIEPLNGEITRLKEIAKTSFSIAKVAVDHFHADHRLETTKSDVLYENWIENACKDKDTVVLVAKIGDQTVGFTAGKINRELEKYSDKKVASLILSAVAPEYRKAQVYTSIIQAFLRYYADKVDIVDIGTHVANYPVQRAWAKLGLKIVRSQHTWHKWLE